MLVYPKQVHFALRILQKSKYERTQKQEHVLERLLESEHLYISIRDAYGEQGKRTFLRGIYLRTEQRIRHHTLHWIYVLYGSVYLNDSKINSGQSIVLGEASPEINLQPGSLVIAIDRERIIKIKKKWQEKQQSKQVDHLKKLPFFSEMESRQLQTLLRLVERRSFVRGAVVFEQGQLAKELFIISHGSFTMTKKLNNGSHSNTSSNPRSPTALSPRQYNSRPAQKQVLHMVDSDIFGQECLKFEQEGQIKPNGVYTSNVVCSSSEGVLMCLNISTFGLFPLKLYLSLPDKIYHFYRKRREQATKALSKEKSGESHNQQAELENYLQKIYRTRSTFSNTSYIRQDRNYHNPEVKFFEKEEFVSMKMKLKYQNILEKVNKLKSLSLKTLSTNLGTNKNAHIYNRNAEREKRIILKELNKEKFKRDNLTEEVLDSIITKTEMSLTERNSRIKRRDLSATILRQKHRKEAQMERPIYTPIMESFYRQQDRDRKTISNIEESIKDSPIKMKTTHHRSSRFRRTSNFNFIKEAS